MSSSSTSTRPATAAWPGASPASRPWLRAQWHAMRMLRAVAWPGWLAGAVAILGLVLWLGLYRPEQQQLLQLQTQAHALEQSLRHALPAGAAAATPVDPMEQLYRLLASEQDITHVLANIDAVAQRHGLQLRQAEYKLTQQAGEPIALYSILLPVKADYKTLRHFIRDVLHDVPSLALEEISVRRDDTHADGLDGRLRFVLYLSPSSSTATEAR